jgi:uncharacterized protein (TIGR02646 family)
MHKLNRDSVPVPACLTNPPEGWTYTDLRGADKDQIRAALFAIQKQRCAYCERRTGDQSNDGHIEHFRDQANHQDDTLAWTNLFWSCNDENTCGKNKDKCRKEQGLRRRFNVADLVDPAVDDPEMFLLFVSDGTVLPRGDLDDNARRRADETIRVFQLNESAYLTRARQEAVRPYLSMLNELLGFSPDLVIQFIAIEVQRAAEASFGTAIKHFLTSQAA